MTSHSSHGQEYCSMQWIQRQTSPNSRLPSQMALSSHYTSKHQRYLNTVPIQTVCSLWWERQTILTPRSPLCVLYDPPAE